MLFNIIICETQNSDVIPPEERQNWGPLRTASKPPLDLAGSGLEGGGFTGTIYPDLDVGLLLSAAILIARSAYYVRDCQSETCPFVRSSVRSFGFS